MFNILSFMKKMTLIYDSTKNSSDLLYKTKFKAPDPIIFFEIRKKTYLVLIDLELERGKKQARVDEILPLREILRLTSERKETLSSADGECVEEGIWATSP